MKTTTKTPLEKALLKAIKDSGLSIYQIAKDSGVDTAPLYNFIHGKRSLTLPTAGRLADALGLEFRRQGSAKNTSSAGLTESHDPEIEKIEKWLRQSWSFYVQPYYWHLNATYLYEAATTYRKEFWPETRQPYDTNAAYSDFLRGPVYMLLSGLALEAMLKGIIIGNNPMIASAQKLPGHITSHDLIRLYKEAGLREAASVTRLLKRLTIFVENFGRYPVTKRKQDMDKKCNLYFCNTDFQTVDRLWNQFQKKIKPFIQENCEG